MKLFWLALGTMIRADSVMSSEYVDSHNHSLLMANEGHAQPNLLKQDRLVGWMVDISKLLSCIIAPDIAPEDNDLKNSKKGKQQNVAAQMHDYTYGITSDPMAVFAIIFLALIHDVNHQGVSNLQLAKEEPDMGEHYQNKSVAEQKSIDLAWDLLMSDRKYMFGSKDKLMRF
jgi:hypothetical protein